MSSEWIEGTCNETTGFLFRHQCTQYPEARCEACDKPICEAHKRPLEGKILCVDCNRAKTRQGGLNVGPRRGYDDDPYYYGGAYYPGYGHYYYGASRSGVHSDDSAKGHFDPNDLNAGDAESLKSEGDEDFENDMSES
jgi:hypothetical protein